MKFRKWPLIILIILLVFGGLFYFQKEKEEKYKGLSLIPEQTDDIPLYMGLEPASPVYKIKGEHWEDILQFYQKELPKNGWSLTMLQASTDSKEDGAGFNSSWEKEGTEWVLSISGAYFKGMDQTEVMFNMRELLTADKWVDTEVSEICINEQPERSEECFKMTDRQTIQQIVGLINGALAVDHEEIPYNGKSVIDFDTITIDVYYDLEKGIYFVSEKGMKWMKPEIEFFELTRISKEY